jgi:hypothetical protein
LTVPQQHPKAEKTQFQLWLVRPQAASKSFQMVGTALKLPLPKKVWFSFVSLFSANISTGRKGKYG